MLCSFNGYHYLFSGSCDMTLKCWDIATGEVVHTFEGHEDAVSCCAVSENSEILYSGIRIT